MGLEGQISDFDLADIIQLIGRGRKTGKLVISGAENYVSVYFKDGLAVFASPAHQRDYLGNILVRNGVVTREDIERALDVQKRLRREGRNVRLGSILMNNGAVERSTLERYMRFQIEETIMAALTEKAGHFEFVPEFDLSEEDIVTGIEPEWVLLETSRQLDEWKELGADAPAKDAVYTINASPKEVGSVNLEMDDWRIISLINGARSVEEIVNVSGFTRLVALRIIANLAKRGVIVQVATAGRNGGGKDLEWDILPQSYKKPVPPARGILSRIMERIRKL